MLIRILAGADYTSRLPHWLRILYYPGRLIDFSNRDRFNFLLDLPNILIKKDVKQLERLTLWIIKYRFDPKTSDELYHTFYRCKAAHDANKETRDNGQPQFHHVLMVTLLTWVNAQEYLKSSGEELRELFLAALYHDTAEDTKIFRTTNTGKQLEHIAKLHGQSVSIIVGYVTKNPYHISDKYPALKEAQLAAHFIGFKSPLCPLLARFLKAMDRMANFADFTYSEFDFFVRKLNETNTYFDEIIYDLPEELHALFWIYINSIAEKHGLESPHPKLI
jgi:(p)ppGpp synthase/HD superfamily hydrolase